MPGKPLSEDLRLLIVGNIISNGGDPETGVFPGNLLPSDFQPFFLGGGGGAKTIVTVQSSLSNNYCLRVTVEGANQNAQRPFFNTEIILMINRYVLKFN
jgi:hypothetical protein